MSNSLRHRPDPGRSIPASVGLLALALLSGCTSLGTSGPSAHRVMQSAGEPVLDSPIRIVDLDNTSARRVVAAQSVQLFSDHLAGAPATSTVIGPGDTVDISITEAPPAVLFTGTSGSDTLSRTPTGSTTVSPITSSRGWTAPQQMVDADGRLQVPFAGSIQAAGRTPLQIERDITARLRGKAHDPQVIVRRVANASANVTVLGDVGQSGRFPLSARGERVLDVLAAAGGSKQALTRSVVQINRHDRTFSLPLAEVARDPRQNVVLEPDDVVTVLYQPYTFTALGASTTNSEVSFESTSFTLSQALGRIGGLQDTRANVKGVFLFRYEDPRALDPALVAGARMTPDGRIPVIYRINMNDAASMFLIQSFPVRDKDVVYIANAPLAEFGKFLGVVTSTVFSVLGVVNNVK